MWMNKKFVYQIGNNKKVYYDARPTKYQDQYRLNAVLNSICHLLALLGAHPILHISRIRVN